MMVGGTRISIGGFSICLTNKISAKFSMFSVSFDQTLEFGGTVSDEDFANFRQRTIIDCCEKYMEMGLFSGPGRNELLVHNTP
jgi:hypothetical protein